MPDPRLVAAIDLLRRTGCVETQVRYDEEQEPIVWVVVSKWNRGPDGRPRAVAAADTTEAWEASGAMTPADAAIRLVELVVDGSICAHCGRPAGADTDWAFDWQRLGPGICWYLYDPEVQKFRRSCEGDTGRNEPCPCGSGKKFKRCHGGPGGDDA